MPRWPGQGSIAQRRGVGGVLQREGVEGRIASYYTACGQVWEAAPARSMRGREEPVEAPSERGRRGVQQGGRG